MKRSSLQMSPGCLLLYINNRFLWHVRLRSPLDIRWLHKWKGKFRLFMWLVFDPKKKKITKRERRRIFREFPLRKTWANKVDPEEERTSEAAIVACAHSAQPIWLTSYHSFPVFGLGESRGRPLPSRRLHGQDVISPHTCTPMFSPQHEMGSTCSMAHMRW